MRNVYDDVTNKIIAMMENGVTPWRKSWDDMTPALSRPLRENGVPYTGINTLMLWMAAEIRGFTSPYWMTFKAAQSHGGRVRKGAKSEIAVFFQTIVRETDNGETTKYPVMKTYNVFNVDEIDGLPEKYYPKPVVRNAGSTRVPEYDCFFADTGSVIRHGGGKAFYSPNLDFIQMPNFNGFDDADSYYSVLAHEHIHWTGSSKRLNRKLSIQMASSDYAMEELIAELGSAFLCAELGISTGPRPDHAAYLNMWVKALRENNRVLFKAASYSEAAVRFLQGKSSNTTTEQ